MQGRSIIAEWPERSEANDRSLFEIPRYLYIYNYIYYIYACMHVNCARPCIPYTSPITSAHCALSFGALAAVRSTTLRSHLFNRSVRWRYFSWRQPGRRQRLKPYAYSNRTQEAPGRRQRLGLHVYCYRTQEARLKPDCRTEGRRIGSRTPSAYLFLYYFFVLYMYLSMYIISLLSVYSHFRIFLLYYYSSFKFINCFMVIIEVRGMC